MIRNQNVLTLKRPLFKTVRKPSHFSIPLSLALSLGCVILSEKLRSIYSYLDTPIKPKYGLTFHLLAPNAGLKYTDSAEIAFFDVFVHFRPILAP